jgi:type II secretory pathway pseudopilin PulG
VELLVVMAILAALAGLGVMVIPKLLARGEASAVESVITQLHASLEAYANDPANGDYPPTRLDDETMPGVGLVKNEENLGIEAVMICLNRRGTPSSFEIEDIPWPDALTNLDQDLTQNALTTFGSSNRELYELCDRWGMPLAYFHHRDYERIESKGLGIITGLEGPVKAKPWKNPKTSVFYRRNGFQLFSAGPDGEFNTSDDITNFVRE